MQLHFFTKIVSGEKTTSRSPISSVIYENVIREGDLVSGMNNLKQRTKSIARLPCHSVAISSRLSMFASSTSTRFPNNIWKESFIYATELKDSLVQELQLRIRHFSVIWTPRRGKETRETLMIWLSEETSYWRQLSTSRIREKRIGTHKWHQKYYN